MAQRREKDLVKNTIILSIGSYLPKLTTLITLPLLTGYLSKAEYGAYDLITTLVSLLLPAATLQIQAAAFRFLIGCRESYSERKRVISNILVFTVVISIISLSIIYFFIPSYGIETKLLIICYFFFDILSITVGQIARGLGRNMLYALCSIISSVIIMLGICYSLLVAHSGINGILFGMIISCVAKVIIQCTSMKIVEYIDLSTVSIKEIKALVSYSWPMVPNALSNWILSLSDRLVITSFVGIEANAIYAVANKIPNLVKTFQGTFVNAWSENAALNVDSNDSSDYYSNVYYTVSKIVAGIVAALIAATPILFRVLIHGEYEDAYRQMPILYLGMFFSCMSSFIGGIYIAHKKTKSIGITTSLAAGCNLLIDLLFVKQIGIYAGSISTLVSYMLLFFYRTRDVQKFQKLTLQWRKLLMIFAILALMCSLSYINTFVVNVANFAIGIGFAFYLNRDIVFIIFHKIARKLSRK